MKAFIVLALLSLSISANASSELVCKTNDVGFAVAFSQTDYGFTLTVQEDDGRVNRYRLESNEEKEESNFDSYSGEGTVYFNSNTTLYPQGNYSLKVNKIPGRGTFVLKRLNEEERNIDVDCFHARPN